ncbi:hypothetical protein OAS76_00770 [Nitrosopumilus sp.]|nr:hypothetical protein [Nitrosopumilus sp.]
MNKIIITSLMILTLIAIPVANAQFGTPAYQKSTQVIIDESQNIQAMHVIESSNKLIMVNMFEGAIQDSITVTDENGKEIEFGINNNSDYGAITIFSSSDNTSGDTIVKYNLKNILRQSDNLLTLNIGYPKTFSILFSEKIEFIYLNNNIINFGDNRGVTINSGGYVNVEYYSEIPKLTKEVNWEEDKFNVEIITESQIDEFNFDQITKSISFKVNEKNKFVTVNMEHKLLGGPYVVLLNDEKIQYSKYSNNENSTSLTIKPESLGQITIIGTTVIPEFSMFLPLIMGFLIILTVPFMKKISLR